MEVMGEGWALWGSWGRGASAPLLGNTQSCLETHLQVGKPRPREGTRSLKLNSGVQPRTAATAFGSKGPPGQEKQGPFGSRSKMIGFPRKGEHAFGAGLMAHLGS